MFDSGSQFTEQILLFDLSYLKKKTGLSSLFVFFQKKNFDEKNLLYDRIADSFVGLFASIHKDVKDKFLSVCNSCIIMKIEFYIW